VDRDGALDRLGGTYARALQLADAGHDHAQIAAELGLDEAAVPSLLEIGQAKLAHLMAEPNADDDVCGHGSTSTG
jgi:DNA-directed RNA polymerase specialized sigma24 family protein